MKNRLNKAAIASLMTVALASFAGSALAEDMTIVIGHTGPLSGPNAFAGKDNENGVRLAAEELSAKNIQVDGKTLKFTVQSEDDACDPKAGVQVAQKLVDQGVKFVMGPYCSGVAIPAERVYDKGGVVMSTVGTNPDVTKGGYKRVFRIVASDSQIGSSMAKYAANVLKVKKVAVIDDRTAFGQGVAEEFVKEAKVLGLDLVGKEFTTDKSVDFTAILTNLKGRKPEAIFFGGYAPQAAPMTKQMKTLAIDAKLLGGDTLCSPEMGKLGGDAINEVVYCAQGGSMLEKAEAGKTFKEAYKKRFNQNADAYAASFYDQVHFLVDAMEKAKSTDPEKVAEQLHKLSYKGVVGTYAYDEMGNMKDAPVTVSTFKDKLPVPLESY